MVEEALRERHVSCVWLEKHAELLTEQPPAREGSPRAFSLVPIQEFKMLYDTCGIWALGPMDKFGAEVTSPWSHVIAGLLHPFPTLQGKNTRGFEATVNWQGKLPIVSLTPDEESVVSSMINDMNDWDKQMKRTEGPYMLDAMNHKMRYLKDHLPRKLKEMGIEKPSRLRVAPPDRLGHFDNLDGMLIPLCRGVLATGDMFDPTGWIWNRQGHWPLYVSIGTDRTRSNEGKQAKIVKLQKKQYFWEHGHWPWWIYHDSEKWYWSEPYPPQFSGEWWWKTRQQYTEEEARAYDEAWIQLYGIEPYEKAIQNMRRLWPGDSSG